MSTPIHTLAVIGTRPEVIKMAPVVHWFAAHPHRFRVTLVSTGQHRQMLDQALEAMQLRANHDLDLMRPNQGLSELAGALLGALPPILRTEHPDVVLVQGDTTTSFAAALAAFHERIPVGHVEAGLRTFDKTRPFPEEANRCLTGVLADLHFAPTEGARQNLRREGTVDERIHVTGNTVIDALLATVARLDCDHALRDRVAASFSYLRPAAPLVLITGHRRESFGPGFERIGRGLATLARQRPDLDLVYPVHLNPHVREPVARLLGDLSNIHLIEPIDYVALVYLLRRCRLVITDSGGIQEEAPGLGKPVLVMRETTERPEAIDAGTARLVGTDPDAIVREARRLLEDDDAYAAMSRAVNPFGDGKAAERIAAALERRFGHPADPADAMG